MLEKDIQTQILNYLNHFGIAVKIGRGILPVACANGKTRRVNMGGGFLGGKGFPDVIFCANGQIYLIEVKRPGGKLSPNQVYMHNALAKIGCKPTVMDSLSDCENFVKNYVLTTNQKGVMV